MDQGERDTRAITIEAFAAGLWPVLTFTERGVAYATLHVIESFLQ